MNQMKDKMNQSTMFSGKKKWILWALGVVLTPPIIIGIMALWFFVGMEEPSRSDYRFCREMPEYVAAFDELNQAVYTQIPVYPDAELITVTISGGDSYFWTPTSRRLSAYYISETPYLQIQEFFEYEMPAQDWYLTYKKLFEGDSSSLYYQNQFTCITLDIDNWDEYTAHYISRISPTSEIPLSTKSTYEVRIVHAQEAVPGAPTPHPEGASSLMKCFTDTP